MSLRWHLLFAFLGLIVLLSGALLATTYIGQREEVENLSRTLLERTVRSTEKGLEQFFDEVERDVHMLARWGRAGQLPVDQTGHLTTLLAPLLRSTPAISSAMIATADGNEWMLMQTDAGWRTRLSRTNEWGERVLWSIFNENLETVSEEWDDLAYDPRVRPWFIGAAAGEPGEAHWTSPYTFFTTRDPGITASTRFAWPGEDEARGIIGLDVLLLDVSRLTMALEVSPRGMAFVLTDDGRVLGLPRDRRFVDSVLMKRAILSPASSLGREDLAAAVAAWPVEEPARSAPFVYRAGDERWWAVFHPFPVGDERLWIGVAVPEDDFLAEVVALRWRIALLTAAAVLVVVIGALVLARRYGRPLEMLAEESHRMETLDLDPGPDIRTGIREVGALAQSQGRMRGTLESFSRYVPVEVVRQLLAAGEVARIGGRLAELSIFFCDIRGFTSIAERLDPEQLTNHMADYFEIVIGTLNNHRATVDKIIGDSVMAFWGAPIDSPDHAKEAVTAALACRDRLAEASRGWDQPNCPLLPTTFGVHTDVVLVGNVGAPRRLAYTVLGDGVNLASRIQGLNAEYGTDVLATEAVRTATGSAFAWRLVDRVAVKGKRRPVDVLEVLGHAGRVDATRLAFAVEYESALEAYRTRRFGSAVERLEAIALDGDRSVERLLGLARRLYAEPPPVDWKPVTRMDVK